MESCVKDNGCMYLRFIDRETRILGFSSIALCRVSAFEIGEILLICPAFFVDIVRENAYSIVSI